MLFLSVLWAILRVLLIVMGAVLLLAVLLLCVRTGVEATGATGQVSVEAHWGVLRIPIWPLPRKKEQAEQKTPKPPKQKEKTEKTGKLDWRGLDIGDLVVLVMTLLDELADTLRISRLRVRVLLGTEDAAKTGLLLGSAAAAAGMLVPFLENTFEMKDYHVSVDADFDADHTEWAFTVFCSLRPICAVFVLLRHGGELYRLYKKMTRKEEILK